MSDKKDNAVAARPQRRGGLGRGLAALIPQGPTDEAGANTTRMGSAAADVVLGGARPDSRSGAGRPAASGLDAVIGTSDAVGAVYQEIPPTEIEPNPHQPRTVFDEDALAELIHSIREFGVMQPIVVRRLAKPSPNGIRYQLVMGERRWRAVSEIGLATIPAIIRETPDGDMLRDALLENIHRAQLNPLEEAAAYQQLLEEFDVTHEELANRLGRSRPLISNTIRLLKLPIPVQRRVAAGILSAGHARALLGLETGSEAQEELAARIVAEGMSVRATEEAVTLANREGAGADPVGNRSPKPKAPRPELKDVADRLADRFDTRVTVTMGQRKGKVVIEFGSMEDLERITSIMDKKKGK